VYFFFQRALRKGQITAGALSTAEWRGGRCIRISRDKLYIYIYIFINMSLYLYLYQYKKRIRYNSEVECFFRRALCLQQDGGVEGTYLSYVYIHIYIICKFFFVGFTFLQQDGGVKGAPVLGFRVNAISIYLSMYIIYTQRVIYIINV